MEPFGKLSVVYVYHHYQLVVLYSMTVDLAIPQ